MVPISFLAGLTSFLLLDLLAPSLPGEGSWRRFLGCLPLLALPWALAKLTTRRLARTVLRGGVPAAPLRVALRLQWAVVPLVFAAIAAFVGLGELVLEAAPRSHIAQLGLGLSPLLAMEISARLAERRTLHWLEIAALPTPARLGPASLRATVLLVIPIMALAATMDALAWSRTLEVWLAATTLGATIGLLLLVALLSVVLPLSVRWLLPTSRALPPALAPTAQSTAAELGFPAHALLVLRTRHRIANAALVGALRWPRYLILTDGLLALLDAQALRGVIAHEIGHARARHPLLLMVIFGVVPILLYQPVLQLDLDTLDPALQALLGLAALALAWFGLRRLGHRFEHEADQWSAEALGNPSACINALQRVSDLMPSSLHRASFRHPSESHRIAQLLAREQDPNARARFWRRGRWLRLGVLSALAGAIGWSASTHAKLWSVDRVAIRYYGGQLAQAYSDLTELPTGLGGSHADLATELRAEITAAHDLGIADGPWETVRKQLVPEAHARLLQTLTTTNDAAQALPWSLLCLHDDRPAAWVRSLYLYSRAVTDQDREGRQRLRAHLNRVSMPDEIRDAIQALPLDP